jgi:hypothetical protein
MRRLVIVLNVILISSLLASNPASASQSNLTSAIATIQKAIKATQTAYGKKPVTIISSDGDAFTAKYEYDKKGSLALTVSEEGRSKTMLFIGKRGYEPFALEEFDERQIAMLTERSLLGPYKWVSLATVGVLTDREITSNLNSYLSTELLANYTTLRKSTRGSTTTYLFTINPPASAGYGPTQISYELRLGKVTRVKQVQSADGGIFTYTYTISAGPTRTFTAPTISVLDLDPLEREGFFGAPAQA